MDEYTRRAFNAGVAMGFGGGIAFIILYLMAVVIFL